MKMKRAIAICVIGWGACVAMATLATSAIAGGGGGGSGGSSVNFALSGPATPVNVLVVMLPSGLKFDSQNQFKIVSESRANLIQDVDYSPDSDNNPTNPNAGYLIGAAYSACTARGAQCLIVEFNPPGLGPNDSLQFTQGVLNGKKPATLQQLAGANVTFGLTSQYITTSELEYNATTNSDTADTQTASTTVPPSIGNPAFFTGSGAPPCTSFINAFGMLECESPVDTGIKDGSVCDEGGQPSLPPGTCP
jgi:hypothetical protein